MDTKALRQKVLDLAIRGKLVPQDPNDEPASVLLERIRQQKQQMVKDGKLKAKDIKNDSIIYVGEDNLHYEKFADGSVKCIEDEIPIELPDRWAWARLTSICLKVTDGTHHSPENHPIGEYKYITAKNIKLNGIVLDDITYVSADVHKEIFARCNPEFGDILYIKDGATSGIATVNNLYEEFSLLSSVALLKPANNIDRWYMCYAMQSPYFYTTTRGDMKGVGITRITLNMLTSRLIPVPPQYEQQQISIQCKALIDLVSIIETEKESISYTISNAKSKILDLAIRGRLVPQDPNDEPTSVLLERIRAEKEALIKAGKIKRDKKESVIFRGEDNSYYFDIPDGWALCSLKDLFNVCSAKRVRQSDWCTEGVPFYRAREIVKLSDNGYVDNDLFISEEHYMRVKNECGVPEPGDLMVSGVGTIGKVYVVKVDDCFYYKDASVLCFENRTGAIDSQFARYMLESKFIQAQMKDNSKGTTVDTITISAAMEYVCVLPPLSEQKRIVAAIETAFSHLNSISEALL